MYIYIYTHTHDVRIEVYMQAYFFWMLWSNWSNGGQDLIEWVSRHHERVAAQFMHRRLLKFNIDVHGPAKGGGSR